MEVRAKTKHGNEGSPREATGWVRNGPRHGRTHTRAGSGREQVNQPCLAAAAQSAPPACGAAAVRAARLAPPSRPPPSPARAQRATHREGRRHRQHRDERCTHAQAPCHCGQRATESSAEAGAWRENGSHAPRSHGSFSLAVRPPATPASSPRIPQHALPPSRLRRASERGARRQLRDGSESEERRGRKGAYKGNTGATHSSKAHKQKTESKRTDAPRAVAGARASHECTGDSPPWAGHQTSACAATSREREERTRQAAHTRRARCTSKSTGRETQRQRRREQPLRRVCCEEWGAGGSESDAGERHRRESAALAPPRWHRPLHEGVVATQRSCCQGRPPPTSALPLLLLTVALFRVAGHI